MAEQRAVEGGNTSIVLTGAHEPLSDGYTTGWMEALMEHAPQTFRGVLPEERITAL